MQNKINHSPVLRQLVQKYLNLKKNNTAIDCTLGLGGHSQDILKKIGSKGLLITFEQDEQNLKIAKQNLNEYKNIIFVHSNFENLTETLVKNHVKKVNGILLDLGLCSSHFELENRGFSFKKSEPLDMRFSKELTHLTAAKIIDKYSVKKLTEIFQGYGEEKYALKIASVIEKQRRQAPIQTTDQLTKIIEHTVPRRYYEHIHPATRIFQALRIEVNNELEVLNNVLPQAIEALAPHGRLVVISYHSLEDRIVKHFLKFQTRTCICPPHILICQCKHEPSIKILTKKPVRPSENEIQANPRSRSALLRAAEKI